jgi:hypothetical protein
MARIKQPGGNIFGITRTPERDFHNLYDVFLNAHLQRKLMDEAPVGRAFEGDAGAFFRSDRGRLERTYVAFLYVLVETWQSAAMSRAKQFFESLTPLDEVRAVLKDVRRSGGIEKMRNVRAYMCHRDKREYWDEGRDAVNGQMENHEAVYQAFSKAFIVARRQLRTRSKAKEG